MEVHCHFIALFFHEEQGWVLSHTTQWVPDQTCNMRCNVSVVLHFNMIAQWFFSCKYQTLYIMVCWNYDVVGQLVTGSLSLPPHLAVPCAGGFSCSLSLGFDTLTLVGQRCVWSSLELCHKSSSSSTPCMRSDCSLQGSWKSISLQTWKRCVVMLRTECSTFIPVSWRLWIKLKRMVLSL